MADDYDLVSIDHAATGWMGVQDPGPHVLRTHGASRCAGETCVIHNPSDHHMRTLPLNWRGDTGVMERICPHGVGHPDPDATAYAKANGRSWYGVHGCDGCCRPPAIPSVLSPAATAARPHTLNDCWCGKHHAPEDFL